MTDHFRGSLQVLAWFLLGAALTAFACAYWLAPSHFVLPGVFWALRFAAFPVVGALIASSRPRQPVGWLLLGIGLAVSIGALAEVGGEALYRPAPGVGAVLYEFGETMSKLLFGQIALLLLLFPTGRLPGTNWRWLGLALILLIALSATGGMTAPGPVLDRFEGRGPINPIGVNQIPVLQFLGSDRGFVIYVAVLLGCASSLFIRYRRANLDDRQRLKWFTLAALIFVLFQVGDGVAPLLIGSYLGPAYLAGEALATVGLAAAIAIAILRHRLFDVDLVISRTVAYALLAALITGFYAAVVVGAGFLAGTASPPRFLLSVAATAIVAVTFQPLRARLLRLADRLVFGRRATPYEVLAGFSDRLITMTDWESIMPEMARVLAAGTGAVVATVWLRRGTAEVPACTWPSDASFVSRGDATRVSEVTLRGELLGRLAVRCRPGDAMSQTEERLMDDLAHQAGFVFRTVSLQQELRLSLDSLRASRERLIAVQDQERQRIERDLHDGAQQNLTALRMKLGQMQSGDVPAHLSRLLTEMQEDVQEAIDSIRTLARGVYPPLLEAQGLSAALTARARYLAQPVEIHCGPERYARDIETAIYFCCSESLQNLAKHAQARRAAVRVWADASRLEFEVKDDGRGFDVDAGSGTGLASMRDRVETLGGGLDIRSGAGSGTSVTGWLPLSGRC